MPSFLFSLFDCFTTKLAFSLVSEDSEYLSQHNHVGKMTSQCHLSFAFWIGQVKVAVSKPATDQLCSNNTS